MNRCRNCNAPVSERYVRVLSRDGEGVDACPHCPDVLRRNGRITEARASRRSVRGDD